MLGKFTTRGALYPSPERKGFTASVINSFLFVCLSLLMVPSIDADEVTRAALDLGGSKTKICVATVDRETNKIQEIHYVGLKPIPLRKAVQDSPDQHLSDEVEKQLIEALLEMKEEAKAFNPQEWVAVGTSALRAATNGPEFTKRVTEATAIPLYIIPQDEEGEIGHTTALAISRTDPDEIIAWDSGSGSFQISAYVNDKLEVYGTDFGDQATYRALFSQLGRAFQTGATPNPLNFADAIATSDQIRAKLPPTADWLTQNRHIVAIGDRDCIFSQGRLATGKESYTKDEIYQKLQEFCGKSDEELKSTFRLPHISTPALILLYTVMDHCGFNEITYFPTNGGCEGVLISPKYWNYP